MRHEVDDLLYATVSAMHSIASTLTGEAKSELSRLRGLLDECSVLPRDVATALAKNVAVVREHLVLGPTPDPIGDGNSLWNVFMAAWETRQRLQELRSVTIKALESLSYILECHGESCDVEAKAELLRLSTALGKETGQGDVEWHSIRDEVCRIESLYQSLETRREAVHSVFKLSRRLWNQVLPSKAPGSESA